MFVILENEDFVNRPWMLCYSVVIMYIMFMDSETICTLTECVRFLLHNPHSVSHGTIKNTCVLSITPKMGILLNRLKGVPGKTHTSELFSSVTSRPGHIWDQAIFETRPYLRPGKWKQKLSDSCHSRLEKTDIKK